MNAWRRRNRAAFDDDAATADVRPAFRARVLQASPERAPKQVEMVTSPGGTQRIAMVDNSARRDEGATEEKELVKVADASTDTSGLQPEELREEGDVYAALRAENEVLRKKLAHMEDLVTLSAEEASYYYDVLFGEVTDEDDEGDEGIEEGETSDQHETEDAQNRRRDREILPFVDRGCGTESVPMSLKALQTSARGAAMANRMSTEHGVDFKMILKTIHGWVRPSMDARRLQLWLCREAPCFESLAFASPPDLRREFKLDSGSTSKYKSPLTTSESQYAQVGYNAVYAAAHALGASDEELKEALTEAKNDNSRKYCLKANYVYYVDIDGDSPTTCVYVGESQDVEVRISTHLSSLFTSKKEDRLQRGHRLAREHIADGFDFEIYMFVTSVHDEDSAHRLARSYIDFSGSNNILEVARACSASGFFGEAVYTAVFGSMHDQSRDGRIGLNFSAPGLMHPVVVDELAFHQRIKLGLQANRARTQGTTHQLIFCDVCTRWRVTVKYSKRADGSDECQCKNCYEAERYAQGENVECESCGKTKAGFQKQFLHPDGRKGIQCTACYNKAVKAARPPWTCQQCERSMRGTSERHRHPGGGHQCRMCKNHANNSNK